MKFARFASVLRAILHTSLALVSMHCNYKTIISHRNPFCTAHRIAKSESAYFYISFFFALEVMLTDEAVCDLCMTTEVTYRATFSANATEKRNVI